MSELKYDMIVIKSAWMCLAEAVRTANALSSNVKRNCINKHIKCYCYVTVSDVAAISGFYGVDKSRKLKRGRPKREYLGNSDYDWRVPHIHILVITDNICEVKRIIRTFINNRYKDHLNDFYSEDISFKLTPVMEYVIRQASIERNVTNDEGDYNFQQRISAFRQQIKDYRKTLVCDGR